MFSGAFLSCSRGTISVVGVSTLPTNTWNDAFCLQGNREERAKGRYPVGDENGHRALPFLLECSVDVGEWCSAPNNSDTVRGQLRLAQKGTVLVTLDVEHHSRSQNNRTRPEIHVCTPCVFTRNNMGEEERATLFKLAQFVSYHSLVGVSHFHIFHELSQKQQQGRLFEALLTLQRAGRATLYDWTPFSHLDSHYHNQVMGINHCLLRNREAADYISFLDLDEFLVMNGTDSIAEWAQRFWKNRPKLAFVDMQSFFFHPSPGCLVRNKWLEDLKAADIDFHSCTLRSLHSEERGGHRGGWQGRVKLLVNPRLVLVVNIHHVARNNHVGLAISTRITHGLVLYHFNFVKTSKRAGGPVRVTHLRKWIPRMLSFIHASFPNHTSP